jgi:glutathione S-transferase
MSLHLLSGNLRYSSWSVRAVLAAQLSGLDVAIEVVPLFTPETNARLAAESPSRKAPLLTDGGLKIWDSLAIAEYLAERAPHLWPTGARSRAVARSACAEMHSGFQALRQQCTMNSVRRYSGHKLDDDAQADVARICALWTELHNSFGAGGDFLFGAFSLADCFYAPVVSRLITYDVALTPEAKRYVEAMAAHPLVTGWFEAAAREPWTIGKYEY